MPLQVENFSRDYLIAPEIEVNTYEGEDAKLDAGVYALFEEMLDEPIIGFTGGLHYQFKPSREVLSKRAAIPKRNHGVEDDFSFLLAK